MDVAFLSEFSSIDEKSMNKEKTGIKQTPWITCLVGFAVGSVVTTAFCFVIIHSLLTSDHNGQYSAFDLDASVTYTRWGKKNCPTSTNLVYSGQVGGNHYNNKGGGVNYLCLPSDPQNGKHQSFKNNGLYGAEYQIFKDRQPSGMSLSLGNKEVPCAVCNRKRKSSLLMIPGRKTCYNGWKAEYSGYLMSDSSKQSSKDYVCVDKNAEALDNNTSNNDHALLVPIRTRCGSLRCPPYTNQADIQCVVCTT